MKSLPTLSTLGFAKNPQEIATRIIEYYNESKPSQSTTFFDKVPNLAQRIVDHGNNPTALTSTIREDLIAIFTDWFTDVDITVNSSDNGDGSFDVLISGVFQYEGVQYRLDEKYNKSSGVM